MIINLIPTQISDFNVTMSDMASKIHFSTLRTAGFNLSSWHAGRKQTKITPGAVSGIRVLRCLKTSEGKTLTK